MRDAIAVSGSFQRPSYRVLLRAALLTGALRMHDRVFRPGDRCDEYTITGFLGSGGFAEVYAGAHTASGERVALKCLQLRHGENEYVTQRMLAEAELLATVDHQNLVQVIDFGKHGDVLYMVMELLEGRTLRDEIKQASQRMPLDRALFIALEIADGLDAAHERRVVHRDLKPDNVFLMVDGRVKVLDLGAGKFYGWGLTSTAPGLIVGTPLYMAPEHVKGGDVDGRTDIYALGVMLYEMCAEHPLAKRRHDGASKAEIALLQIQYEPPPLRMIAPEVPGYVSDIAAKAMAKRPDDRFGSMSELARALRHARGRLREELGARRAKDAAGDEEDTTEPRVSVNGAGSGVVRTPSTAMTPAVARGGTDPVPRASVPAGTPGHGAVVSGELSRGSVPDAWVTEAGTVRMSVPAAFGRTEPLPSSPPVDALDAGGAGESLKKGAEGASEAGAGRATGMVSSVTPPMGSRGVDQAERVEGSPRHRQAILIVLGFGLGVLLMGILMLVRDRNASASSGGAVPSAEASARGPEPEASRGSPSLPSEPVAEQAPSAVEPVRAASSSTPSGAPVVPAATASVAAKRSVPVTTSKAASSGASAKAPVKAPVKAAMKPERPKAEAPVLLFE